MRKHLLLGLVAAALVVAALPLAAQQGRPRNAVTPPAHTRNLPREVFVPGFGFRPVIQEAFPVFGWGFDAHHFTTINPHRRFGFFGGGGFFGQGFFGGFFPSVSNNTTVVVVPQPVQVQVPVPVMIGGASWNSPEVVVPLGLPENWDKVQFVRPSYPVERAPLPQLTLIVLKDQTIFAATDYWLEDGRLFFVTSTGLQKAVAVRELDWDMTVEFNAERGVEFVVRSGR